MKTPTWPQAIGFYLLIVNLQLGAGLLVAAILKAGAQ